MNSSACRVETRLDLMTLVEVYFRTAGYSLAVWIGRTVPRSEPLGLDLSRSRFESIIRKRLGKDLEKSSNAKIIRRVFMLEPRASMSSNGIRRMAFFFALCLPACAQQPP